MVLAILALLRLVRLPLPKQLSLIPPYAIGSMAMFWVFERMK